MPSRRPGPQRPGAAELAVLRRRDRRLAALMDVTPPFPGFPEPSRARRESHFGALARAILFQQLAGKAAATICGRVAALTPGPALPRPAEMLALLGQGRLRAAGVSGPKQRALTDLSQRVLEGRLKLPSIARYKDDEVIAALIQVHGIGRWSAQMFLFFRLGRLDVMPEGDLGIQEGLRRLDGHADRPRPAEVLARAEVWRPWRSVAAWHLWRATERPDPGPAARRTKA